MYQQQEKLYTASQATANGSTQEWNKNNNYYDIKYSSTPIKRLPSGKWIVSRLKEAGH